MLCIGQFIVLRPLSELIVAPQVLMLSLVNGTLCTFLPVVMVMMGISRIGAPLASQCGMAGPVSTISLGAVFLGERVTPMLLAGTGLVLAGIWLLAWARPRIPPAAVVAQAQPAHAQKIADAPFAQPRGRHLPARAVLARRLPASGLAYRGIRRGRRRYKGLLRTLRRFDWTARCTRLWTSSAPLRGTASPQAPLHGRQS